MHVIRSWEPFQVVAQHVGVKVLNARDPGAVRTLLHRLEKMQTSMARVVTIGVNNGLFGTVEEFVTPNSVAWLQRLAEPTILSKIVAAIDRSNDYVCKTLKRSTLAQTILGIKNFIRTYALAVANDVHQAIRQYIDRINDKITDLLPTAAEVARDSNKQLVDLKSGQPYVPHSAISNAADVVRMLAEDTLTQMEVRNVNINESVRYVAYVLLV